MRRGAGSREDNKMVNGDHALLLWGLGALNTMAVLLLGWIKYDQRSIRIEMKGSVKELWGRLNTHGHDIDCAETGCKPRTTGVLIRENDRG